MHFETETPESAFRNLHNFLQLKKIRCCVISIPILMCKFTLLYLRVYAFLLYENILCKSILITVEPRYSELIVPGYSD